MTTRSVAIRRYSQAPMLRASLVFWCVYMLTAGVLLMFVPDWLVNLLGFPALQDGWIRLFGALAFNIGLAYIPLLRSPFNKELVIWTIYARYFFASITVLAVLLGWFPAGVLIIGGFDTINATWTWLGLRRAGSTQ